jgi:hypothetical protein
MVWLVERRRKELLVVDLLRAMLKMTGEVVLHPLQAATIEDESGMLSCK